jgi:hypothetical protein
MACSIKRGMDRSGPVPEIRGMAVAIKMGRRARREEGVYPDFNLSPGLPRERS